MSWLEREMSFLSSCVYTLGPPVVGAVLQGDAICRGWSLIGGNGSLKVGLELC